MNHFELFGLPVQFDLNGSLLASQFRELQRRFHPDKFATQSEQDKLLAVQKASQINDAYQVLKQPISRAEYLLVLQGIDIRAEQQTLQDSTFLMQQMEWREELEQLQQHPQADELLVDFEASIEQEYQAYLTTLTSALDEQQWQHAATLIRKIKFIAKLKTEIELVEERLLD